MAATGAVVLSAGVGAIPVHAAVEPAASPTAIERPAEPVPDQYIVTLHGPPAEVEVRADSLASEHGGTVLETYEHALTGFSARMSEAEAAALSADPSVAAVEQDGYLYATATQTPVSWGLDRIDQRDLPLDDSYSFDATGRRVTAYVIDSGIRTTHSDFGGRASVGVDTVGDGRNGQDCNGHGTHVAGIIGGERHGVAKDVNLVAVRVLGCQGSGLASQVIAGIEWVTANHAPASVANMSIGSTVGSTAVDTAVANSIASGVTHVVAAGNDSGGNACSISPARVGAALTVAATTPSDARASFSNIGPCVDLFAPGIDIVSDSNDSDIATEELDGTSMAAPHVAGTAALVLQGSPAASPAQVAAAIIGNATPDRVSSPGTGSPNRLLFEGFVRAPTFSVPVQRIFGQDAIGTSLAISQAQFRSATSASAVVLARSDFFADALAGGPLAAARNAPLLITPGAGVSAGLDPRVLGEIQRVLPAGGRVYVLGGPLALASGIDAALQGAGYEVVRVQGVNQFATAVAVADELGNPAAIFEATGLHFADALSAVPAAIEARGVIVLTNGSSQAPETAAYLGAHPTVPRYAIGGPLAAAGADPAATAVFGQDLYDTSAAVATTFFPDATVVGGATGADFPDALSGGVLMGSPGQVGPLLLVAPGLPLPPSIAGYLDRNVRVGRINLFGGPLAVGDDVAAAMALVSGSGIT